MNLAQKVAQLMIIGFEGHTPNPITEAFLKAGVGGVIFFRDNFQGLEARTVTRLLTTIHHSVPADLPIPFLSIDQEGGQVERLPHTLFPSLITPLAVSLAEIPNKTAWVQQIYATLAQGLHDLGFNMNFFPTLDVNLEPQNPIIGVRAFGSDPETVWDYAHIAMAEHLKAGVIPVGKHFPGHGNGTVDSHLSLPVLNFTNQELEPFQNAIDARLPAMLVAHGYYPSLQAGKEPSTLPSSASPLIVQDLLRKQCGFNGVIITDDMCMGAITQTCDAVEAALKALEAGVDVLLYKQSTQQEWDIYQAIIAAVQSGRLSEERINQSVERIKALKATLPPFMPDYKETIQNYQPHWVATQAASLVSSAITVLSGQRETLLPLQCQQAILLVHPNRAAITNYAFDQSTSEELPVLLAQRGLTQINAFAYHPKQSIDLPKNLVSPECIVWITFNPQVNPTQQAFYQQLKQDYPTIPLVIIAAGMPDLLLEASLSLALCSYRPPSLNALADYLTV